MVTMLWNLHIWSKQPLVNRKEPLLQVAPKAREGAGLEHYIQFPFPHLTTFKDPPIFFHAHSINGELYCHPWRYCKGALLKWKLTNHKNCNKTLRWTKAKYKWDINPQIPRKHNINHSTDATYLFYELLQNKIITKPCSRQSHFLLLIF